MSSGSKPRDYPSSTDEDRCSRCRKHIGYVESDYCDSCRAVVESPVTAGTMVRYDGTIWSASEIEQNHVCLWWVVQRDGGEVVTDHTYAHIQDVELVYDQCLNTVARAASVIGDAEDLVECSCDECTDEPEWDTSRLQDLVGDADE